MSKFALWFVYLERSVVESMQLHLNFLNFQLTAIIQFKLFRFKEK